MGKKKLRVYLSAPVSGKERAKVIYQFMKAECAVRLAGYIPVNPITEGVTRLGWDAEWIDYMKLDIPLLASCNFVWFFSGEPDSEGVTIERAIAESFNIKTIQL